MEWIEAWDGMLSIVGIIEHPEFCTFYVSSDMELFKCVSKTGRTAYAKLGQKHNGAYVRSRWVVDLNVLSLIDRTEIRQQFSRNRQEQLRHLAFEAALFFRG
jgi:hypothetical protein